MKYPLIEFHEVTKIYKNFCLKIPIYTILKEKTYLLIGANGTGKSTFIKLILKLIYPSDGEVNVKPSKIAYIPDSISLPGHLSIYTFLLLLANCRMPHENNANKIKLLCQDWDLDDRKKINSLSKGMKQKLLIIQALIHSSSIYIFDEPLNGLDNISIQKFFKIIEKLKLEKKTILIITHEPQVFKLLCDLYIIFKDGNLVETSS